MAVQTVPCPHCEGLSKVDDSLGQANFCCPHCQGVFAPIPASTSPPAPEQSFVILTGDQRVTLRDTEKTIEYRGATLRIRELSREEKQNRRRTRNAVLGVGCIVVLIIAAAILIDAG